MRKTIGEIAGRIKFTEKELGMTQGLAEAIYEVHQKRSSKSFKVMTKDEKDRFKESIYKLVSKFIWEYKCENFLNKEIGENTFDKISLSFMTAYFK